VLRSPLDPHVATPRELQSRIDAERRGSPFLIYRDGGGEQIGGDHLQRDGAAEDRAACAVDDAHAAAPDDSLDAVAGEDRSLDVTR